MATPRTATGTPPSLEDIHASVPIPTHWWRRFLAFSGPALLVSVGYMDPGNWATDLGAGSKFGYRLLWVLLMSNLMAVLLQSLATRLGVVTGRDLAQACREAYPRRTVVGLWLLTEIAIAATDLAEVVGTIIGLKLLFGLPYLWGLLVAAGDTFLLLALQRRGVRLLELVTLALVAVIAGSFFVELFIARPDWARAIRGLLPTLDPGDVTGSLYLAIGMLGATVMPHNLYLHSALVQTRAFPQTTAGKRVALKYNLVDSLLALNAAFLVNAAILLLAAASFSHEVSTLSEAHQLLHYLWPASIAAALFAVALVASGQSSTLTGTLSGQVVMEGFVHIHVRPWVRRLITRSLAIIPALVVITLASRPAELDREETTTAAVSILTSHGPLEAVTQAAAGQSVWKVPPVDRRLFSLLVLSQVILSFQLPFAIIPLVQLTSDARKMGPFANRNWLKFLAWGCAAVVVVLNVVLIALQMKDWAEDLQTGGTNPWWIYGTVGPLAVALGVFLLWITLYPLRNGKEEAPVPAAAPELAAVSYRRIGVAVEFAGSDDAVLAQAAALARGNQARLLLVHVVEGFGASFHGADTDAQESRSDRARMTALADHLRREGLEVEGLLGYGNPAEELVRLSKEREFDLLVLGTHGHRLLADLALGRTVSPVLHRLSIPVLVVPSGAKGQEPSIKGQE